MPQNYNVGRRSFLRNAAVTATMAGGLLGGAQTVAAAQQEMKITGFQNGSEYTIEVRPDSSPYEVFTDDIDANETHTYTYNNGEVAFARLKGDLNVDISNEPINVGGEVSVGGVNDVDYAFGVNDSLEKLQDCESHDNLYREGGVEGVNGRTDMDDDVYDRFGGLTYMDVWPGGKVEFDFDLE